MPSCEDCAEFHDFNDNIYTLGRHTICLIGYKECCFRPKEKEMIKMGNPDVLKQRIERMKPFKERLEKEEPNLELYLHWEFEEPRHRWRTHIWAKMRYLKGFSKNAWKRYYK